MSQYSCVCVRRDVNGGWLRMCTNVSSELNINCKLLQVPSKGKMIVLISVIIGVIQNLNKMEFFTVKY